MKNITFEGISTLQRLHLCWQIRKQIGKIHQPIKVEFHQPICRKQYSSLWYGGLVVSIKVRGCVFAIHACGDIYATLYDKSDVQNYSMSKIRVTLDVLALMFCHI